MILTTFVKCSDVHCWGVLYYGDKLFLVVTYSLWFWTVGDKQDKEKDKCYVCEAMKWWFKNETFLRENRIEPQVRITFFLSHFEAEGLQVTKGKAIKI